VASRPRRQNAPILVAPSPNWRASCSPVPGRAGFDCSNGSLPLDYLDTPIFDPAALCGRFLAFTWGCSYAGSCRSRGAHPGGDQPWQTLSGMILLPLPLPPWGRSPITRCRRSRSPTIAGLRARGGRARDSARAARYRQQCSRVVARGEPGHARQHGLPALLDVIYRQLNECCA